MDGMTADLVNNGTDVSNGNFAVQAARLRFRAFFEELKSRFLERDDTIEQIALALLAKEHVLLTGPPGTAKSALARAVLQNVVDRDSGLPSLFARQFTESTVQTDLIGPLDFKTLMASGRSEHFTDEGMLGAVHAFLDEVLDGRDMLLRTTLNVLQEREFKQGTKTTSGAIECALMTSNRYLFEVLEQSRETLLAFVDRIAFVSFVPKGFSDPKHLVQVLNGQLGGQAYAPLPQLTIQDVDQLQSLVSYVRFSESMVGELVALLGRLEAELAAATRADPRFVPTRYLSTRTAVRTARILRAGVIYDWVMNQPTRSFNVYASDFGRLRSTLLLGGPTPASLAAALEHEVDPRERRQLSICQTESQLFARVLAGVTDHPLPAIDPALPLPTLGQLRGQPLAGQVRACQELARRADGGGLEALEAQRRLGEVVQLLTHELLSECVGAGIAGRDWGQASEGLLQLADSLGVAHVTTRHFAPLLRTRALELLEANIEAAPTTSAELIRTLRGGVFGFDLAAGHVEAQLRSFTTRLELRARLMRGGATPRPSSHELWKGAAERMLTEVVKIWELALDGLLASLRVDSGIEALLGAIKQPIAQMNACGRHFVTFGHDPGCVASRVLSTKLMPYIWAALAAEKPSTREAVAAVIQSLLDRLQDVDALYVVSSSALTRWVAATLLDVHDASPTLSNEEVPLHFEGYRQLRQRQASSSLCHALVASCTYVAQYAPELRSPQTPSVSLVQAQLADLDAETVQRIRDVDEARIRCALEFLERWWQALTAKESNAGLQLDSILASRFYELLVSESVLVRFTLEAELLRVLFPSCTDVSRAIAGDIASFRERVEGHVHGLMHDQAVENRRVATERE